MLLEYVNLDSKSVNVLVVFQICMRASAHEGVVYVLTLL